jgi:hypothetical protein
MLDQIRRDIKALLDELLKEIDKLRRALAALTSRESEPDRADRAAKGVHVNDSNRQWWRRFRARREHNCPFGTCPRRHSGSFVVLSLTRSSRPEHCLA